VDEHLIAEGRLRRLQSAEDVVVEKRQGSRVERIRRDPRVLAAMLTAPVTNRP
jgi:hypothetical protein